MVSSVVYLTASIGHLYDVIYQNNASSLHDFNPRFSSGFHSLIARDSRNDSFSQLSDLLITSVFSRTQFIWKFILSISNPSVWNIPPMSFQASQWSKCFRMALSGCDHWLKNSCSFQVEMKSTQFPPAAQGRPVSFVLAP